MKAQATGVDGSKSGDGGTTSWEGRMLQARLDLMVGAMPSAVWINPGLALFWLFPFTGIFPRLGVTPWPQLLLIMVLQVVSNSAARPIYRGYQRAPGNSRLWLRRLAVFQAVTGTVWGLFGWFVWANGNYLNNVLVTMTVCSILWVYSFTRSMHAGVYLAGVVPMVALTIGRILLGGGPVSMSLALIIAITFGVIYIFTYGLRRQVEVMLRIRFANDDLAVELRDTRDDALRKRFEAEAANASKTTFLANMSHELRTPLNAILGFSELIASETLGPVGTPRYREYAQDINTSGAHLLSLINDILDIAKIESGKMEISPSFMDPRVAIESATNVIQLRAREKGQTMTVDVAPEVTELYTDDRAFKQIVINLLSNAVKFTPEGGHVAISMRRTENGDCKLCVSDDGPGIPAALLDQIFMPFNQVDNRYSRQNGGTGLGLSLVRGLAELHGGTAWIESDAGKGVRAYVVLPSAPHREDAQLRRA